jgi:polyisoprenoid-binding protein YceI
MTILRFAAITAAAGAAALFAGVAPAPSAAPPAAAETLKIDSGHSSNVFRCLHNNAAYFYGRFNEMSGEVVWDEANPSASSLRVEIKTTSVDTNNEKRDGHLRSSDFFNADQFPVATFKSTSIFNGQKEATYEVAGDLTIAGVTKPITVMLEKTGASTSQNGRTIHGFETTFTINRHDYGVTFGPESLGSDVRITISIEAAPARQR